MRHCVEPLYAGFIHNKDGKMERILEATSATTLLKPYPNRGDLLAY